jgi:hypothetical protein
MGTSINATSVIYNDNTTQNTAAFMGANNCLYENNQTIGANYTITTNRNAMSVGPITVADGVSVTVPSGSIWIVL